MIFSGADIVAELTRLEVTHLIWIPDSDIGRWETDLESSDIDLVRVCREGEAWPLAAGLIVGGQSPVVALQTTGLFESGDALRNVVHDLQLPVFAIIGARSWMNAQSRDSAKTYADPILRAWQLDCVLVESEADRPCSRATIATARLRANLASCCWRSLEHEFAPLPIIEPTDGHHPFLTRLALG